MTKEKWNTSKLPIYGCLTGIELPSETFSILAGVSLRRVYVDTIGTTMMAFTAPPAAKAHHPGPIAAVRGGLTLEGRIEVRLTNKNACDGLAPSVVFWLVATVLRLRVPTPIRLAVIANMPFDQMGEHWREVQAVNFESAPQQIGAFTATHAKASEEQLLWLRDMLPVAVRLYHNDRFFRALSVYDQAQWAPTLEMGTVLVWTAVEILFDLSGARAKTKAICRALSGYIAEDQSDRDKVYQVIQNLYFKRGQAVHAGRSIDEQDGMQSFRLAQIAFQRVLIDGSLPALSDNLD